MNFFRETFLPIVALLFGVVMLSVAIMMYGMNSFESECVSDGGRFMVEGWTAWCRY